MRGGDYCVLSIVDRRHHLHMDSIIYRQREGGGGRIFENFREKGKVERSSHLAANLITHSGNRNGDRMTHLLRKL
jgi:hypothetical protein